MTEAVIWRKYRVDNPKRHGRMHLGWCRNNEIPTALHLTKKILIKHAKTMEWTFYSKNDQRKLCLQSSTNILVYSKGWRIEVGRESFDIPIIVCRSHFFKSGDTAHALVSTFKRSNCLRPGYQSTAALALVWLSLLDAGKASGESSNVFRVVPPKYVR